MKILQIAGYSNSGKTTLIQNLIKHLGKEKKVSVIKHHGHENQLTALDTGKDTGKFRNAGAASTTVVAGTTIQMHFDSNKKWTVQDVLTFQSFIHTDLVIIEGFKKEAFPKIVLIREEGDLHLLHELTNIISVIIWDPSYRTKINLTTPIFLLEEQDHLFKWLPQNDYV